MQIEVSRPAARALHNRGVHAMNAGESRRQRHENRGGLDSRGAFKLLTRLAPEVRVPLCTRRTERGTRVKSLFGSLRVELLVEVMTGAFMAVLLSFGSGF
jgi:hypothetical protein